MHGSGIKIQQDTWQPNRKVRPGSTKTRTRRLIAEEAKRLDSFVAAMADGKVTDAEVKAQEERVVKLLKEIEPQLDAKLHDRVTELLCELTAYDMMQMLNMMHAVAAGVEVSRMNRMATKNTKLEVGTLAFGHQIRYDSCDFRVRGNPSYRKGNER